MIETATKILVLLGLLVLLIACSLIQLSVPTVANTATPTATHPPTTTPTSTPTSTPSPTPRPTATPTATLAPLGKIQRIPRGLVYLGNVRKIALGFDMSAGGAIGSLLYYGHEFVDHADFGRYIQLSLYDGNQQYTDANGNWGWNPIQAGSKAYIGAKVLEVRTTAQGIYIKANGKEWGESNQDSDVVYETWAWQRDSYFEVHVRATHIGSDTHASHSQEFPAAYFDTDLRKQFGYFGSAPFTAEAIADDYSSCRAATPTENWLAYANADGRGLILAVPPQPYLKPRWNFCFLSRESPPIGYAAPVAVFGNPPNAVHEAIFYLIPGYVGQGRLTVYDLIPHTTWTFDLNSTEGWQNGSATDAVKDGILTTHLTPGKFMTYANLQVRGAGAPGVTITTEARGADTILCLYFLTADDSHWNRDKRSCLLVGAAEFQPYTFDFSENAIWKSSIITELGLTAFQPSVFEIDEMRMLGR